MMPLRRVGDGSGDTARDVGRDDVGLLNPCPRKGLTRPEGEGARDVTGLEMVSFRMTKDVILCLAERGGAIRNAPGESGLGAIVC